MTDFRSTFERLGLHKYIGIFAEEGFETWETILDITESDLYVRFPSESRIGTDFHSDALGVKLGHRRVGLPSVALYIESFRVSLVC